MSLERGTVIEMNIRLGNPTEYGKSEIIVIKTFDSSGN